MRRTARGPACLLRGTCAGQVRATRFRYKQSSPSPASSVSGSSWAWARNKSDLGASLLPRNRTGRGGARRGRGGDRGGDRGGGAAGRGRPRGCLVSCRGLNGLRAPDAAVGDLWGRHGLFLLPVARPCARPRLPRQAAPRHAPHHPRSLFGRQGRTGRTGGERGHSHGALSWMWSHFVVALQMVCPENDENLFELPVGDGAG